MFIPSRNLLPDFFLETPLGVIFSRNLMAYSTGVIGGGFPFFPFVGFGFGLSSLATRVFLEVDFIVVDGRGAGEEVRFEGGGDDDMSIMEGPLGRTVAPRIYLLLSLTTLSLGFIDECRATRSFTSKYKRLGPACRAALLPLSDARGTVVLVGNGSLGSSIGDVCASVTLSTCTRGAREVNFKAGIFRFLGDGWACCRFSANKLIALFFDLGLAVNLGALEGQGHAYCGNDIRRNLLDRWRR